MWKRVLVTASPTRLVPNVQPGICWDMTHAGIVQAVGPGVSDVTVSPGHDAAVTWVPRHHGGQPWRAEAELQNGEYATTVEMLSTRGSHRLIDQRYVVLSPVILQAPWRRSAAAPS